MSLPDAVFAVFSVFSCCNFASLVTVTLKNAMNDELNVTLKNAMNDELNIVSVISNLEGDA